VLLWHKPLAQWRAYRATYTLCATTSAAEGQTVLELAVLFYFLKKTKKNIIQRNTLQTSGLGLTSKF
jgi:hypothetical protein